MADISQEIDQLRNAVYGEEVRGAFISCICSGEKITRESRKWIDSNLNRSARIFI